MMKKNSHITAFYLETILLILVFMTIILVLTKIFGGSKGISSSAKNLNRAVCLAGNAAEAVAASDSPEAVAELLSDGGDIKINGSSTAKSFRVDYDENMRPSVDGFYHVDVTWEPEKTPGGTMVSSNISVLSGKSESPVYQLKTAVFLEEESR